MGLAIVAPIVAAAAAAAATVVAVVAAEVEPQMTFEAFWIMYPRKVARKDALKAWASCVREADLVPLFSALVHWRRIWLKRDELEYVPYPGTWVRGERWTDELPTSFLRSPQHASHVPCKVQEPGERSVMPAAVRELLAQLKGRA